MVNLLLLLSALVICDITWSHPQCLDYRPPFETNDPNPFCSQYAEFGCCSESDNEALRQHRENVRIVMGERWESCGHYVDELLCQQCSPYAAHIYDAEVTQEPRRFPGLCRNYCEPFYDECREVVQHIDSELPGKPSFDTRDDFCQEVAIPSDVDYCFPDLLHNPIFNDQLNNTQITGEGCLCLEEMLKLPRILFAKHGGDGTGRLFVVEQSGIIFVFFPGNKTMLQTPFLDIRSKVLIDSKFWDERGLLSIAFHPDYANNGRFFLHYSAEVEQHDPIYIYEPRAGVNHKSRVSEMRVSQDNPNVADPDSERILIEIMQPFWNHNGGEILFGDDGYLYVFGGDGGGGGDTHRFSQNKSVLIGKVLRLDVDAPSQGKEYSIPPDNPFVNEPGTPSEIYAYGIRNIWGCSMDRGDRITGEGKGRIFCADVGQSAWEEIDFIKKGANYGWNAMEGPACYHQPTCGNVGEVEPPVFAYDHSVGKSVTGGVFYRGCESPNLNGQYVYGDYMVGKLFSLTENQPGQWHNKEIFMCESDLCFNGLIGQYERNIVGFAEDEAGEIYLVSRDNPPASQTGGALYKFVDPVRRGDPSQCQHADSGDRVDIEQMNITTVTPTTTTTTTTVTTTTRISTTLAPSPTTTHARSTTTVKPATTTSKYSVGRRRGKGKRH